MSPELQAAYWAGDLDALHALAPCRCCCDVHTFADCPAREWHGCRSGLRPGERWPDAEGWAAWYAEHRGMDRDTFYNERS